MLLNYTVTKYLKLLSYVHLMWISVAKMAQTISYLFLTYIVVLIEQDVTLVSNVYTNWAINCGFSKCTQDEGLIKDLWLNRCTFHTLPLIGAYCGLTNPIITTCGLATVLSSLALLLASVCMMSSGYRVALWSSAGFSAHICPKLEGHSFDSARMADSVFLYSILV